MIAAGFNEHAKILNEGDLVEILLPGGGDWLLCEVRRRRRTATPSSSLVQPISRRPQLILML